jgi:alpha-glucoside transport system permease protein
MKTNPLLGWAFALPALTLITIFLIYSTIKTILLSFDTGAGFGFSEYVGTDNYVTLFTKDRYFFHLDDAEFDKFPPSLPTGAVFNTARWLVLFTLGTVGIGLIVAVMANSVQYEVLIKTIIFIPMAISFTAAGIIWRFVYSPDPKTGILNALLQPFTSGEEAVTLFGETIIPVGGTIAWLGKTNLVNYAIIISAIWIWTGFCTVILSAGLKSLPQEVIEAARVDGANGWQVFWRITVPMLWPTILVVTTTMIINVLKAFDLVFIMTNGGPRNASRIIGFTMYFETFNNGKAGYGSAVAVIMLILVLPFVIFNIRRFRAEEQG